MCLQAKFKLSCRDLLQHFDKKRLLAFFDALGQAGYGVAWQDRHSGLGDDASVIVQLIDQVDRDARLLVSGSQNSRVNMVAVESLPAIPG